MHIFHRKSRWQRLSEKLVPGVAKNPAVKTSAMAVAGAAALTAASAAVSAIRRKANP